MWAVRSGTIALMFELGNNLREARQRHQIDLVIAEQDTKIRSKYLSALETEDFDVLPGAVFVRGFLRTYARYLGLDPQLFIDEYNARFGRFEEVEEHASPVLGRPGLALEREHRGRRTMRSVAIVSVFAIAALTYIGLRDADRGAASVDDPASTSSPASTTADAGASASDDRASTASTRTSTGAPKLAASSGTGLASAAARAGATSTPSAAANTAAKARRAAARKRAQARANG